MQNFWESSFKDKQVMWGFNPSESAILAAESFKNNGLKEVLIPGCGYGRNAKPFLNNHANVTGIEVSRTAIDIAKKHFGNKLYIYEGNVNEMPFDEQLYDGIFCYALIHLLNENDRRQLIDRCYDQLNEGGLMVFVAISTNDDKFGEGKRLSENRFLTKHRVELFFYDQDAVHTEFEKHNLIEAKEVKEPAQAKKSHTYWYIKCQKKAL